MRKTMTALLGIGATVVLLGTTAVASASARNTTGHHEAATITAARQFTATGTVDRDEETTQTVNGTYKNAKSRPFDVTVFNSQDIAKITTTKPKLDNAWAGGYWHRTYDLDQWLLGTADGDTYHLMLPPAPMGPTFKLLLVTEFGSGGNLQNWMLGTSH